MKNCNFCLLHSQYGWREGGARFNYAIRLKNANSLGQVIRNRRKELSYTQKYISEITGFSMSFLSDLENGKATCEIGKTLHLMNLLGLNINVEVRK